MSFRTDPTRPLNYSRDIDLDFPNTKTGLLYSTEDKPLKRPVGANLENFLFSARITLPLQWQEFFKAKKVYPKRLERVRQSSVASLPINRSIRLHPSKIERGKSIVRR
ncbi:hypothetical protein P8C59_004444 [Phyllachora maydis]|uniref:Uncharacterized protein n=1 Tax=Phyllachora maydis TaxID=1825666 RepID=A0AAD9MEE1_9PEZI|nr:hypothetical protein P8C59_004444 [Phyllachora maydis]